MEEQCFIELESLIGDSCNLFEIVGGKLVVKDRKVKQPFYLFVDNIINGDTFTVPELAGISPADTCNIQVINTGTNLAPSQTPPTAVMNGFTLGADGVFTLDNPIGEAGSPCWLMISGFYETNISDLEECS